MNNPSGKSEDQGLAHLAIDPEVLAKELAAEGLGDPLEEIELAELQIDDINIARECEAGLSWLKQGSEESLQGLRIFCEHRDERALPLLLPLLEESCPVIRMSAVYALGRNPCPSAIEVLLKLLATDGNAYVRKATAWSLGNYADAPVLKPLINALKNDVAAVRLWASGSLAEAGSISADKAEEASRELLISLQTDIEPVVRSNCVWALGRLYNQLNESMQLKIKEEFFSVLLNDIESSVRYESRVALEQMDDPKIFQRIKDLLEETL